MAILLNDAELFAMRGLPHAAVCLYIAIRQCMDMATGMVGIGSMISWQALVESLYIEPEPGRVKSGSPSKQAVRRLGDLLDRAGLVKISSNSSNRQLIFKCIHAHNDKSVKKQPDTHPDTPPKAYKPTKARVVPFKKPQPDTQPDIHPSFSSLVVNKSSSNTLANDDDDNFTESKPKPENQTPPLIYPPRTEDWQQRMATMLRNIPQADAQMLLDELAGQLRAGRVSKPLGYFNRMLENYLRGDFRGELAPGEARIRKQREDDAERRRAEIEKPVYQRSEASAQQALDKIKAMGILRPKREYIDGLAALR
jgi:hypothetical protein